MDSEKSNNQIDQMDEIAKGFQREAEALRELVKGRDQVIKALKAHSLCMRVNFKNILEVVIDRFADDDIQFHSKKMLEQVEIAGDAIDKIYPEIK